MSSPRGTLGSRCETRRFSRPPAAHLPPIPELGIPISTKLLCINSANLARRQRQTRKMTRRQTSFAPVGSYVLRAACKSTDKNARTQELREIAKRLGLC